MKIVGRYVQRYVKPRPLHTLYGQSMGGRGGGGGDINHGDLRAPVKKGNAIFIVISRAVTYNKLNFYINALTSKGLMAGTDFNYRYRFIANTY